MSVSTETQRIEWETTPTRAPLIEMWEEWKELQPAETLSPEEQRDRLRSATLLFLANETELNKFISRGGEIAISLYGELSVTDPLKYVLKPRRENFLPIELPDDSRAETHGHKRNLYTMGYLDLVDALKNQTRNMAMRDFGDPTDPQLPVSAEERAAIAQAIDDVTNHFMYNDFDETLAKTLLSASITGDIVLQMNPTDAATAMRQGFMWLDQVREKLGYTHDINGVSRVNNVKIVAVPFAKTPERSLSN